MEAKFGRSRHFDIPDFFYYEAGNITTGSENTFNFRISPEKSGDDGKELKGSVWYGMSCFEMCTPEAEESFPCDGGGYTKLISWIDDQFDSYSRKVESGEVKSRRTYRIERNATSDD